MTHYRFAIYLLFFISLTAMAITPAHALIDSRPLAVDSRIHTIVYNPDDVFKFTGYYGYQSSIEFAEGETVDTISMGDSTAWQLVPAGRRIFLKPIDEYATTNMTVITNKRMYQFEIHADEAEDISDPNLIFSVRFLYAEDSGNAGIRQFTTSSGPDLSQPEKFNFNYTISGSESIAPLKIFDDAEFTYFKFKTKNADIPAFFLVDSEGRESLINYRVAGDYIVIERVTSQFTLRNGSDVVCVFNESLPLEKKKKK